MNTGFLKQKRISYIIGVGSYAIIGILTIMGIVPIMLCAVLATLMTVWVALVVREESDDSDQLG